MSTYPWYEIKNSSEIDSPSILVFRNRVEKNIQLLIQSIDKISRLRPHVKTHKSLDVCQMLLDHGISKFKCATIAEAEILAKAGAKDILLAYQPVGPKGKRLFQLVQAYPQSSFSFLIDNKETANEIAKLFSTEKPGEYFIDINIGMNRTGIAPENVVELYHELKELKNLKLRGLHGYDGHIRDMNYDVRKEKCDEAFIPVALLKNKLQQLSGVDLIIIAGGSPTYPIHAHRGEVECSPGTFIYWDKGYEQILPEQKFQHAAVVMTRIISKPAADTLCIDLGHKSIASENPLANRVSFLNAEGLEPVGHSEEHMVLKNSSGRDFKVGDILYGIPYHVCPTIALHDFVNVVVNHEVHAAWKTESRNRKIEF
jgi:D-threonine aldolase